ncbi:MAG: SgcJ/EcaC family oxidoreductase [Candidatus Krumholzibacteria bacterium]
MKTTTVVVAVLGVCLLNWAAASNAQTQGDQSRSAEERKAIEATLLQYEKALNKSDVKGVLELYAPDGVFMPSGAPSAVGTEKIKAAYEYVFSTIKLDIKFTIDEIVQSGNYAFARTISRGQVTILAAGVTAPEENRELFVLQKRDGAWKIARYMFNKMSPPD